MKEVEIQTGFSNFIKSFTLFKIDNYNFNYQSNMPNQQFYNNLMYNNKNRSNKNIVIIILAILLLIGIAICIYFFTKKEPEEPVEETIYETAYRKLDFNEDSTLTKVYCTSDISNGSEVSDKKILIYYFNKNELKTYIYHNDIILTDAYMDYYDEMYDKYLESLEKDYKYKNVKTSIEKGDNEILVTVITSKAKGEGNLAMPIFVSPQEAKQKAIAQGYTCK